MMFETIFKILACHMIGDYVLQSDFIAKTKGENWYHLFAHSILYAFPFYLFFGFDSGLLFVLITHFITDAYKARYKAITYTADQIIHYVHAAVFFILFT